jgi:hypothetical protein
MDLSLRFISKRTVSAPERSYRDKSALSTNAAAARELLNAGIFFFIGFDRFSVHVTGADRPDQLLIAPAPQREHKKYFSPTAGCPTAQKRLSFRESASLGTMARGRANKLSSSAMESPCFSHLALLPRSQSKPSNCKTMITDYVGRCIGKCNYLTSAANPPAPSHHARGNTWPALDTSAPRPHTWRKPRCDRKHVPPVWYAARRCRRPRRNPF